MLELIKDIWNTIVSVIDICLSVCIVLFITAYVTGVVQVVKGPYWGHFIELFR